MIDKYLDYIQEGMIDKARCYAAKKRLSSSEKMLLGAREGTKGKEFR